MTLPLGPPPGTPCPAPLWLEPVGGEEGAGPWVGGSFSLPPEQRGEAGWGGQDLGVDRVAPHHLARTRPRAAGVRLPL